jgi:hypothetical protein
MLALRQMLSLHSLFVGMGLRTRAILTVDQLSDLEGIS